MFFCSINSNIRAFNSKLFTSPFLRFFIIGNILATMLPSAVFSSLILSNWVSASCNVVSLNPNAWVTASLNIALSLATVLESLSSIAGTVAGLSG